jgi:transcriptional regulator GlxA family with amidase domain
MKMIATQEEPSEAGRNVSARAAADAETGAGRRIEESVAYMSRHLDRPLQVATLAAKVNISPSHFFALFKRQVGSAPMDYFTRLRMQRASKLLEQTSLSVKEIAFALGYDDPFYFSRVFKSVNGEAPSDYRASRRVATGQKLGGWQALNISHDSQTKETAKHLQFA